ncbi:indolepyruvate ferredoxin oxidoreductase subunit alpha [Fundidesulfovibrio agrisoli]|uniref:indolepyruvate ferredoxin oxidoreductase subunit alpha n=1 Tax=Fundidesulfovibrio agrisoli TaxID=2922717 RepID=UPI001FADFD2F|nr:indolepyruvate ferredoxin oxidoreductase subunit alpha [Fundidesulfovibrio agrisoli]
MANPLLADTPGEVLLLLGNEAIVRGALEGGIGFVSCYPGTPSSEVPDTFYRLSPQGDYIFEYSTNEKVALEVGAGAALAGLPTLVTMKHVGVNVAADPLLTLSYITAPGGLVLLSADDPGCHSSQNEQDNRYYARLAGLPCFEPATAQECKDMARDALHLAARTGQPVLLRTTTRVNHVRGPVKLGGLPKEKPSKPFERKLQQYVPIPAHSRVQHRQLLDRLAMFAQEASRSTWNKLSGAGEVGVLASGIARCYLSDALLEEGLHGSVKVLELGFTYPMPDELLLEFVQGLKKVLVLEELEPLMENHLRQLLQRGGIELEVFGKGETLPLWGEYSTEMVRQALRLTLGRQARAPEHCAPETGLANRPPNLCAGCSHRASYATVREVFGSEAYYSSDIGCYTLGLLPPLSSADFLVCMGSSISTGSGFATASGKPTVAFIGDSTFFHSGITGLVNAVYNNHNILVVVLDNRTTAMTGHQPHPGVDHTVLGPNERPIEIEPLVRACGVSNVVSVNPLNHKASKKALESMKDAMGPRVIIFQAPCVIHERRTAGKGKPQVAVVEGTGAGCLDVLNSLACPAFVKEGGTMRVDEELCSGCMFCLQLDKSFKAKKRGA